MESYKKKETTKYQDNKVWINSAKKFCIMEDKLPDNAVFWKEATGSVPQNIIASEERKKGTVYHVHKVGASKDYFGKHLMYIVRREK